MRETPATGNPVGQRVDGGSMQQQYADARATARNYLAPRSLQPPGTDRLTAESHWHAICAELISARSLSRPFPD